jgi:hypothetical protein
MGNNLTRGELLWGTYGKGGVEHCGGLCPEHQLQWVKLEDRESSHLQAILRSQRQIVGTNYETAIHRLLTERGETPEKFSYGAEQAMFDKYNAGQRAWRASQRGKTDV